MDNLWLVPIALSTGKTAHENATRLYYSYLEDFGAVIRYKYQYKAVWCGSSASRGYPARMLLKKVQLLITRSIFVLWHCSLMFFKWESNDLLNETTVTIFGRVVFEISNFKVSPGLRNAIISKLTFKRLVYVGFFILFVLVVLFCRIMYQRLYL